MRSLTRLVVLVLIVSFVASAPPPLGAATTDTFRDDFNAISYSGNDGVGGSWAGDWWDSEDQDENSGVITVDSEAVGGDFVLRFNSNGSGQYIERTADLSAYDTATLSFDYRRRNTDPTFSVKVWASANGPAGPFTEVFAIATGDDPAYVGSGLLDLTAHRSATATIRFSYEAGALGAGKDFYVDNVEISASSANLPPVAGDDTDFTLIDTPVTIDVLANDSDPDLDGLTVDSVTQGTNGAVVNTSTDVTYTPNPGWTGTDSFTYTATDGNGEFATATVAVMVVNEIIYRDEFNAQAYNGSDGTVPWSSDWFASGGVGPLVGERRVDADGTELYVLMFDYSTPGEYVERTADLSLLASPELTFDYRQQFMTAAVEFQVEVSEDGSIWDTVWSKFGSGIDASYVPVSVDLSGYSAAPTIVRFTHVVGTPANFIFHVDNVQIAEAANQAPTPGDDTDATTEDTPVTVDVLANDSDPDLDVLAVDSVTQGSNGSVVNNGTDVTYSPDLDWHGTDTFTYTASDGNGGFASAQVTVTVSAQPDPPVAVDDVDNTPEDTAVTVDVLANDSDPDLDVLAVDSITQGTNGSVVNNGTDVTYDPNPGWDGTDTFTYTVTDGNGGFDTAMVTVTVAAVNDDPTAVDDADNTLEDTAVTIDVLSNDSDPELDPLTVDSVTQGSNGSVVNNGTDVTYDPDPDWNGTDTFTYTAADGDGGFATATVTVTVTAQPDPPVAVDDSDSTAEDTAITVDILANDSDPDLDVLAVDSITQGANGSVVNNGTDVTYDPDSDWSGIDTFTYTVTDGNGGFATATVTITVSPANDDPTAVDDTDATAEDTAVTVDVLGNDTDPELDPLTVDSVTQGTMGSVVNNGTDVTYDPDPDWNGTDTFTYRVTDGNGGFATGTVTVTVTPVNDDPVAVDDTHVGDEDEPHMVPVLDNDDDPDGDPLNVVGVIDGTHGTVINNGTDVTYVPDPDWSGTDTFMYTVSDGNGGSASALVTMTVNPLNDDPLGQPDLASIPEDNPVTVDVLANDTDVDSVLLTISAVVDGSNGTVTTDGLTLTYTPDPDWNGTDAFTYRVSDDLGGWDESDVTVTVTPVNDDPVAVDDSETTVRDNAVYVWVLNNDSDVDLDTLSVSAFTAPSHGSVVNNGHKVTYTPNPGWTGTDTFTYTVFDGNGGFDLATATVTVTAGPNRPPIATDDNKVTDEDTAVVIPVLANDSDPDGDPITVKAVNQGAHGSVTKTSTSVTYTPEKDWTGIDSFSYTIIDGGGLTATAAVVITVKPVNDTPNARDDSVITPSSTAVSISVLANDTDADGDHLSVATTTQGSNGVVTTDGNVVTYSPSSGWTGTDSFTYTVSDGNGGSDSAVVVVAVDVENRPPVVALTGETEIGEDDSLLVEIAVVDPDGDEVVISASDLPGWASLVDDGTGHATLTGTPGFEAEGSSVVTITVTDGAINVTEAITITVINVNQAPVIGPIRFSGVNDDGSFTFSIAAFDPDGDPVSIVAEGLPSWATLTDNGAGTVTISSDGVPADATGSLSVAVMVTDGVVTVTSNLVRPISDLRNVRPPELTHQVFEIEGADALLATELTARVATPSRPNVRLTPREGLMVAFGSAVETLKSQIVPALILGVIMAWMLMIGVGRTKEEETA